MSISTSPLSYLIDFRRCTSMSNGFKRALQVRQQIVPACGCRGLSRWQPWLLRRVVTPNPLVNTRPREACRLAHGAAVVHHRPRGPVGKASHLAGRVSSNVRRRKTIFAVLHDSHEASRCAPATGIG
jgi:hypothetical protein